MAVGFPVKDDYATGDVLTAANMNDFAGTLNTVPNVVGGFAAGKNKIINGDFGINQRAFTSTTTSSTYGFDRWVNVFSGGTITYSSQAFTLGDAPVAGYEGKNFARLDVTGQSASGNFATIRQLIESVRTFAGQTVTVSFWAKAASATPKVYVTLRQNFGTGGSPSSNVDTNIGAVTLSTSWARYSVTTTLPSISGKTLGTDGNDNLSLFLWGSAGTTFSVPNAAIGIQTNTFDFWGVQVEAGSIATPFQTATGTLQGELAACQRYYFRQKAGAAGQHFSNGNNESTTKAVFVMPFPTLMRIAPTALEQSGTAGDYSVRHQATSTTASAVPAFESASTNVGIFTTTVASGLTAGNGCFSRPVNTSAYLGWSAEL